ncbi:hypothetical protein CEXT_543401 [Caerostris extrusa]|uniref:Uncharacterized protein n=1 Tax=Caerostris extrusa TaxID=172846 RepID=A0AAV4VR73_CAEEX|nr:hypothetical protein CEXT_543401 [Caerostris extrusa]
MRKAPSALVIQRIHAAEAFDSFRRERFSAVVKFPLRLMRDLKSIKLEIRFPGLELVQPSFGAGLPDNSTPPKTAPNSESHDLWELINYEEGSSSLGYSANSRGRGV